MGLQRPHRRQHYAKGKAFSIYAALVAAHDYAIARGLEEEQGPITVQYPVGEEKAHADLGDNRIDLGERLGLVWDVIFHEYGHHVAKTLGIHNDDAPGGEHTSGSLMRQADQFEKRKQFKQ